ncbi:hypothetical protein RGU70_07885 [Herbaspirillum sp. RTI4]|nr:hypothetical protein [Herbaspirillum sp. RTI4]MDY7578238.1 hypothetical protein [Herbaspirillum sp. RTI4]MEA9981576.1 hypothetical protein [Herbaspirillum sp. RTI4]
MRSGAQGKVRPRSATVPGSADLLSQSSLISGFLKASGNCFDSPLLLQEYTSPAPVTKHNVTKLSEKEVQQCINEIMEGKTQQSVAWKYGVSASTIGRYFRDHIDRQAAQLKKMEAQTHPIFRITADVAVQHEVVLVDKECQTDNTGQVAITYRTQGTNTEAPSVIRYARSSRV